MSAGAGTGEIAYPNALICNLIELEMIHWGVVLWDLQHNVLALICRFDFEKFFAEGEAVLAETGYTLVSLKHRVENSNGYHHSPETMQKST